MCLYNENTEWIDTDGAVAAAVPRGFSVPAHFLWGTGSWLHCVGKRGRASFSPASSGFLNSALIRTFGFVHNALHRRYISLRLPRHNITAGSPRYQRDDGKSASHSDSTERLH